MNITRRIWEDILVAFAAGITFVGTCCMILAFLLFRETGDSEVLFYHKLVTGLDANAVYMAWYTLLSLSALLLFRWQRYFRGRKVIIKWLIIAIQLVFFILLSSRMLLVTFFIITIPTYLGLLFSKLRLSRIKIVGTVLISILLVSAIAFTRNPVRQRFDDVLNNDIHQSFLYDYHYESQDFTNLTLRLFVWRMAIENMNEYHLWWQGAGNGDVHTLQNHRMARYGIKNMDDKTHTSPMYNVDLHNTYLQTLLAVGIPGLIALLLFILSPFFVLRKSGDKRLFFIFFFASFLFMLQEAVFQTQAGIIFYAFFYTIFWNRVRQHKAEANPETQLK
jgi:O-antigen ligase